MPWMQDGIDAAEAKAIDEIRWLARSSRTAALSLVMIGWVRDDISDEEAEAIDALVGTNSGPAMSAAVAKPWVEDGISSTEKDALLSLWRLGGEDSKRYLEMPFLHEFNPHDAVALKVLAWLARDKSDVYRKVTTSAPFEEGLTDTWAIVVTTLGSALRVDGLLDRALDPTSVNVERRIVTLPISGDISLAFVRIDVDGSGKSIEIAQDVLVEVESVMGMALPTAHVGVLVADGGWWGHNSGTHVAIRPLEDQDPDTDSSGSYGLQHLLTHEFAHYYWRGHQAWIDEGIANTLADLHELRVAGRDVFSERSFGCKESAIRDIDEDSHRTCPYDLGTQLFTELHGALGDAKFREALRALYLMDGKLGIAELRRALEGEGEEVLAIIDRWYLGE